MITIVETELERILKLLLQKQVVFVINHKTWRSGRLLLFKQNGFFIEFIIKTSKSKQERFEIPIPFVVNDNSDNVTFSYKLNDLVIGKEHLLETIKDIKIKSKSKFYDGVLLINIVADHI